MKLLSNICMCLGLAAGLGCNKAADGFGAPVGSSVELLASTAVNGNQDHYVLATVKVKVPEGETLIPGNNIFVTVSCSTCSLFDRAAGESVTVADPSRLQEVSNPYSFSTNNSGVYQLVIKLENPADLGVTDYTANVFADIVVESTSIQIAVGSSS